MGARFTAYSVSNKYCRTAKLTSWHVVPTVNIILVNYFKSFVKYYMKKIAFILAIITASITGFCQQALVPVNGGSKINFTIKNFGFNTGGSFTGLTGSINYNPANIGATVFNVTVNAASINTDNKKRDEHLRKEEYFDASKFPVLNFKSTKVSNSGNGVYIVDGFITIKGVSKPLSFPFKITTLSVGYLFQGSFELNRRDFGVGGSSAVLGDKLKATLSVFAK